MRSVHGFLHGLAVLANTLQFKQIWEETTLKNTYLQRFMGLYMLPFKLAIQVVKAIAVVVHVRRDRLDGALTEGNYLLNGARYRVSGQV